MFKKDISTPIKYIILRAGSIYGIINIDTMGYQHGDSFLISIFGRALPLSIFILTLLISTINSYVFWKEYFQMFNMKKYIEKKIKREESYIESSQESILERKEEIEQYKEYIKEGKEEIKNLQKELKSLSHN